MTDHNLHSIRSSFGSVAPDTTEGSAIIVLSSGMAADATHTNPGAAGSDNVSTSGPGTGKGFVTIDQDYK